MTRYDKELDLIALRSSRLFNCLYSLGYDMKQCRAIVKHDFHPNYAIIAKQDAESIIEANETLFILDLNNGKDFMYLPNEYGAVLLQTALIDNQFALATSK